MKARSMCGSAGSDRRVSRAGAMRSSMRSANPARSQARRAIAVHSSLTSQQVSAPPGARPRAMHSDEYPVKVPTSTARRAVRSRAPRRSRPARRLRSGPSRRSWPATLGRWPGVTARRADLVAGQPIGTRSCSHGRRGAEWAGEREAAMTERVTVATDGGVADVRLNRPDKLNALDADTFVALVDAGARLAEDTSVRAVVLSGEGRAFSAGLDFSGFM